MMSEAEQLNKDFLKRIRTGSPHIQLKLDASLDGRTTVTGGENQRTTSPQARRDVQRQHAQSRAILTSNATVLANDPALTVRWSELDEQTQALHLQQNLRQPVRTVTDSQNRVAPEHRTVQQPGETWFACMQEDPSEWPETVHTLPTPEHKGHLDLVVLMVQLDKQQISGVWVEAGPTFTDTLLQAGLVDKLIVYITPRLLSSGARGLCTLPGFEKLADAPQFKFREIRHIGPDVCLHLVGA